MISEQDKYLARVLLQQNIITQEQLNICGQIMEQATTNPTHFTSVLVQQGFISAQQLGFILQKIQSSTKNKREYESILGLKKTAIMETGRHFNHYRIDKELGRGGMGVVYKAYDTKLNREVALKVILIQEDTDQTQIERFMQEARSLATLDHPSIIRVYDVGEVPQNYFTMEYINGPVFSDWIRKNTEKIEPKKIAQIIRECAQALAEVHKKQIVHRDIKPGNIMLDKEFKPRLMDFGLVKILDSGLSKTGEIMGTPAYMSPEQAQGNKVRTTSDIYSLGASLYEALVKRPPFQGSTFVNIAYQVVEKDPVLPRTLDPDIPIDLEAICLKCLEKKPEKRYENAQILARDLDNFVCDRPVFAKPATKLTFVKKFILRNKTICGLGALVFMAIIFSIAIYIISQQKLLKQEQMAKLKIAKALDNEKVAKKKAQQATQVALKAQKEAQKANKALKKERDDSYSAVGHLILALEDIFKKRPELQKDSKLRKVALRALEESDRLGVINKVSKQKRQDLKSLFNIIKNMDPNKKGDDKKLTKEMKKFEKSKNAQLAAFAHYSLGFTFYHKKKYKQALEKFNISIKLNPQHSKAYAYRGLCYVRMEKFEDAIREFNIAMEKDPADPGIYVNRSYVYIKQKKLKKAGKDLLKALKVQPDFPMAHYNLACVYSLMKNKQKGLFHLEQAFKKGFKNFEMPLTQKDVAFLRQTSEFEKLIKKYKEE